MILICISSNILSFECGNSFSKTSCVVMTCSWHCQFVLSYYHTILTQHFIFKILQYSVTFMCNDLPYVICTCIILHYTIKHDMVHFIYTCTHVLHNINLVMLCVLFILNVSFYPTYTIWNRYFDNTMYEKSVEFRMYFRKRTYDYSGILTKRAVIATATSTCQSSHSMKFIVIQQEWNHFVLVDERTTPGNI